MEITWIHFILVEIIIIITFFAIRFVIKYYFYHKDKKNVEKVLNYFDKKRDNKSTDKLKECLQIIKENQERMEEENGRGSK